MESHHKSSAAALRVRQRFSGFYDLPVRHDASASDIDSSNFDADAYVSSLLKSKPLPDLVGRSNELSSEIKELDSDMQMLVYENYNKFISATETIRAMKEKVDGMDGEMERLASKVSEITESSFKINSNLAERRVRIQRLNGIRRLLKKLSFIFELPTRLKRAVELDAGAEAVKYWRTALPVLRAYGHVPSFKAVEAESTEILVLLQERLRSRLSSNEALVPELQECALLLLQLGETKRSVQSDFLEVMRVRLKHNVRHAGEKVQVGELKGVLSRTFLDLVKDMLLSYQMLFLAPRDGEQDLHSPAAGKEDKKEREDGKQEPGDKEAADGASEEGRTIEEQEQEEMNRDLLELCHQVLQSYFAAVEAAVANPDLAEDAAAVLSQLELWYDAVRGVEAVLPEGNVLPQAERVVHICVKKRVQLTLEHLASFVQQQVRAIARSVMLKLRPLIFDETYEELVRLFDTICVSSFLEGDPHASSSSELSLRLACFWRRILEDGFPALSSHLDLRGAGGHGHEAQVLSNSLASIRRTLSKCLDALLRRYVQLRSHALTQAIVRCSSTLEEEDNGQGRRALTDAFLQEVEKMERELVIIVEEEEGIKMSAEEAKVYRSSKATSSLEVLDLSFKHLRIHKVSLLLPVIAHGLRTLVETLRVLTFSHAVSSELYEEQRRLREGVEATLTEHSRIMSPMLDEVTSTITSRTADAH
ncbi:Ang2 protein [Guillardia theta CCMP2712]|uniref:Vacuolar protein sorting-associated protein 51 homolog n=1 Tax=Guillardia theta (strain CCMP2712) TaxID=905079 RepID=L1JC90_GUITC|nr:Ang2 protein [Guillardia theta CCMP2712]EKX46163.1 Ang2 protein [Guillardia theta CCMP2712]|eukprot:XP_005833143.1 Ang2 protein [Guillardia theta CCMP2712]